MARLKCPSCKGSHITLLANDVGLKTEHKTSLDLNPLHPFTVAKTKTVQKEKLSMGKLALGMMTGGASLLVTGIKQKKHNEYLCQDCGRRWVGK